MGVDVYMLKDLPQEVEDYLAEGKKIGLPEKAIKYIKNLYGKKWVMQFSLSYSNWLPWIVTSSGEDPERINMVYPMDNKRFLKLLVEGHPWGDVDDDDGHSYFDLDYHDCVELKCDLQWFIEEVMPTIKGCEYLKAKTTDFYSVILEAIEEKGILRVG